MVESFVVELHMPKTHGVMRTENSQFTACEKGNEVIMEQLLSGLFFSPTTKDEATF